MSYLVILISTIFTTQVDHLNVCENLKLPKQIEQSTLLMIMESIPSSEEGRLTGVWFKSYKPIEELECNQYELEERKSCQISLLIYEEMCSEIESKNSQCKLVTLFPYDGLVLSFTQDNPNFVTSYKFYKLKKQWELAGEVSSISEAALPKEPIDVCSWR